MKKCFVVFSIAVIFVAGCFVFDAAAQQVAAPPLLVQPNQAPPMPPPAAVTPLVPPAAVTRPVPPPVAVTPPVMPPAPGAPPVPPASASRMLQPVAPPPPPGPGVTVSQTVPVQALLADLPKAEATIRALGRQLAPGKVWVMRAPGGELEIKAGLLYGGVTVAVLHFNPRDGSLLPLGVNPRVYQSSVQIQAIKNRLDAVIRDLKILPAAEFVEPEASWSFPIAAGDIMVARLKVYYDGIHVMQDYPANQEMMFYGQ